MPTSPQVRGYSFLQYGESLLRHWADVGIGPYDCAIKEQFYL